MKYKLFRIMVIIKLETKKANTVVTQSIKSLTFINGRKYKFVDTYAFQKGNKRNAGSTSDILRTPRTPRIKKPRSL
jgi:hypothetical protein